MVKSREALLKTWEKKARQVYQESLNLMRDGIHGLEVMAGKTMEVTRIKIANQKALHTIRSLFTELGQRAYDALRHQTKGAIRITPDISSFAAQIRKLQQAIDDNLEKLRHITTVSSKSKEKGKRKSNKTGSLRRH